MQKEVDRDWKNVVIKPSEWSKLIKITSRFSKNYYYVVLDDNTKNCSNDEIEGLVTRWGSDTVTGYQYMIEGCRLGFLSRRGVGEVRELSGVIELFYAGVAYRLSGDSGEYSLPQSFISSVISSDGNQPLSIKLSKGRGDTNIPFPVGKETVKSIARLFQAEKKSAKDLNNN